MITVDATMNMKYSTPILTPSSAPMRNRLRMANTRNIMMMPPNIAMEIPNPKVEGMTTVKSNLTMTWNTHGMAGHREILHIPIWKKDCTNSSCFSSLATYIIIAHSYPP